MVIQRWKKGNISTIILVCVLSCGQLNLFAAPTGPIPKYVDSKTYDGFSDEIYQDWKAGKYDGTFIPTDSEIPLIGPVIINPIGQTAAYVRTSIDDYTGNSAVMAKVRTCETLRDDANKLVDAGFDPPQSVPYSGFTDPSLKLRAAVNNVNTLEQKVTGMFDAGCGEYYYAKLSKIAKERRESVTPVSKTTAKMLRDILAKKEDTPENYEDRRKLKDLIQDLEVGTESTKLSVDLQKFLADCAQKRNGLLAIIPTDSSSGTLKAIKSSNSVTALNSALVDERKHLTQTIVPQYREFAKSGCLTTKPLLAIRDHVIAVKTTTEESAKQLGYASYNDLLKKGQGKLEEARDLADAGVSYVEDKGQKAVAGAASVADRGLRYAQEKLEQARASVAESRTETIDTIHSKADSARAEVSSANESAGQKVASYSTDADVRIDETKCRTSASTMLSLIQTNMTVAKSMSDSPTNKLCADEPSNLQTLTFLSLVAKLGAELRGLLKSGQCSASQNQKYTQDLKAVWSSGIPYDVATDSARGSASLRLKAGNLTASQYDTNSHLKEFMADGGKVGDKYRAACGIQKQSSSSTSTGTDTGVVPGR